VEVVNALTFDVEDYFQVQAFADVVHREEWSRYPSRVERNTYRILEMLAKRNVRATFFILGWVAKRCAKLVRDIQRTGHEIGSHGYHHQMIGTASPEEFRADITRAKAILEDQLGSPVRSYRAPSYSITARTLWALEVLGEVGFTCDSSIFPVVHDHYGIPDAPRFPHYRRLSDHRLMVEFPPSTLRLSGVNIGVAGGGYLRFFPYSFTAWAIRRINRSEHQPAMVYLHPWEFDPDQPRIAAPWRSRFRHYQNLRSTESKLERLLNNFSWGSMSDVLSASFTGRDNSGEVVDGL
jgi:polysaccharide deacetylase family protein (PEP-CTERM system associated)